MEKAGDPSWIWERMQAWKGMEEAELAWAGMEKLASQSSLRASRREEGDALTMPGLCSSLPARASQSFILEPQEVGRGLTKSVTSRRGWKEVAFNLRQRLLGTMSFPGPVTQNRVIGMSLSARSSIMGRFGGRGLQPILVLVLTHPMRGQGKEPSPDV